MDCAQGRGAGAFLCLTPWPAAGSEGASAAAGETEDHRGLSATSPSSATSVLLSNVIGPIEEKNN